MAGTGVAKRMSERVVDLLEAGKHQGQGENRDQSLMLTKLSLKQAKIACAQ